MDIPFEMRRIFDVADYIDTDAAAWLRTIDRSADVYAKRPHSPVDTVMVPAKVAWPFYETNSAYVCQPGRWFQPVDRIAFYADREIKREVPRITVRRDNVPWTASEESRLAASSDREDRKVGAVIGAARAAGWTEGSYQVFLLTRTGDPAHRSLNDAVAHLATGRGSAFVQRQRYASLHALQTAKTTDDL